LESVLTAIEKENQKKESTNGKIIAFEIQEPEDLGAEYILKVHSR
jgi:hypothetical protein